MEGKEKNNRQHILAKRLEELVKQDGCTHLSISITPNANVEGVMEDLISFFESEDKGEIIYSVQ